MILILSHSFSPLEKDIYIENSKFIYPVKIVVNLAYVSIYIFNFILVLSNHDFF